MATRAMHLKAAGTVLNGYCRDEAGNQFSYLGPLSSLERIASGGPFRPDRHGPLFPLFRAGWPARDVALEPSPGAFAFLRARSTPEMSPDITA